MKKAPWIILLLLLPLFSHASLRISPEAALSFPHALQIGASVEDVEENLRTSEEERAETPERNRWFSLQNFKFFWDFGYLKYASSPNDSLELFDIQLGARYFPLNSWSFISQAVGYRAFSLSRDISTFKIASSSPATSGELNLKTLFYFPALGLSWRVSDSVTLETELGVQISLYADGLLNIKNSVTGQDSTNSPDLATDSKTAMSRIASLIIPELTLVRMIYHFD